MQSRDATTIARHARANLTPNWQPRRLRAALLGSTSALVLGQMLVALPALATSGPCIDNTTTTPGTTIVTCTGTIGPVVNTVVRYDVTGAQNLTIDSTATISTTGQYSNGIEGSGASGSVTITSSGAVSTSGDEAVGIYGYSTSGNLSITSSGAVSTSGEAAYGIVGYSASGNISITSSGAVSTSGDRAVGIYGFSQSGNVSIDITGTGSVTSNGSGTQAINIYSGADGMLTNAGTVVGDVYIHGGTRAILDNAGTIWGNVEMRGNATFNNLAGGVFNSYGTINLHGGTLNNAGTMSPGGSKLDTTTLTGNYVQTSTGVLMIDAYWPDNVHPIISDKLVITGTARLAGTVVVTPYDFPNTGGLTRQFTVLTAAGGITNDGISIANTAAVNYVLIFPDDNTLDVKATINFQGVGITGLTANQSAIGGSLNAILGSGTTLGFMPALMGLPTGGQLAGALDQLAPVGDGGSNASAMATGSTFAGQLLSCRVAGEGDANAVIREGQCVWARASARRLDRDSSAESTGLHETATFVSGGVQVKLGGDWRLGGGIGYEDTALATTSNASSKGERLHLGGVLKYNPGPWLFAGTVTGGHGWNDNIRRVSFGGFDAVATSDSETSFVAGRLTGAYLHQMGPLYLKPQIEVASTHLNRDGYNESGTGGIALAVREASATVWSASPSLELGTEHRTAGGGATRLFLKGGATWLDTDTFTTSASFLGAPAGTSPFAVTSKVDRVVADVGAGIDLITKGDTALRLQYDGQFGDTTTQHIGSAKLGVKF